MSTFRKFIQYRSTKLIFVDPGIVVTGYAVFSCIGHTASYKIKLIDFGKIKPKNKAIDIDEARLDQSRCQSIANNIRILFEKHAGDFIFIEIPPQTMYDSKKLSKDFLIARAQSVFKTFSVAYEIDGLMSSREGCKVNMVLPSQWQLHKTQRKELGSKIWSLAYANKVIARHSDSKVVLSTIDDRNIADAISMGERVIEKMLLGEASYV